MLPEPFGVEQDLHSDSTRIPPSTDQVCDGISGEMQLVVSSENENPNSEPFLGTVAASEMAFATQYPYFTRDFALEATTKKPMNTHQIPSLWPPLKPPIDSDALLSLNTVSSGEDTSLIQVSLNRLEKRTKSDRGAGLSHLTSKAAKTDRLPGCLSSSI